MVLLPLPPLLLVVLAVPREGGGAEGRTLPLLPRPDEEEVAGVVDVDEGWGFAADGCLEAEDGVEEEVEEVDDDEGGGGPLGRCGAGADVLVVLPLLPLLGWVDDDEVLLLVDVVLVELP